LNFENYEHRAKRSRYDEDVFPGNIAESTQNWQRHESKTLEQECGRIPLDHSRSNNPSEVDGYGDGGMLSFKSFLQRQDDNITEIEAQGKYNLYKTTFKRITLGKFFNEHKDEEWLRRKYHPVDNFEPKLFDELSRKRRLELFWELFDQIKKLNLDWDHQIEILEFMDSVVEKLEKADLDNLRSESETPEVILDSSDDCNPEAHCFNPETLSEVHLVHNESNINNNNNNDFGDAVKGTGVKSDEQALDQTISCEDKSTTSTSPQPSTENTVLSDTSASVSTAVSTFGDDGSASVSVSSASVKESNSAEDGEVSSNEDDTAAESKAFNQTLSPISSEPDKVSSLPSNFSIHLRRVPTSVTKEELEILLRKHQGYLRLSLSDPTEETDFKTRRGYVTFTRDTNVKDVCVALTDLRFDGRDIGPVINKEIIKKVRVGSTILDSHEAIVRNDIKLASKIIQKYDNLWNLRESGGSKLLENVNDYLVEVVSAEEDELLGVHQEDSSPEVDLTVNESMNKYLDTLLLYLRLVHSIDFYNYHQYSNEDLMPNKFGLIHVRGPLKHGKVLRIDVESLLKSREEKLKDLVENPKEIKEFELFDLGFKDVENEVEVFIKSNIQEIGSGKFFCPLSGKKFKGVDYVRKHIVTRFDDKLEDVRKRTKYLNNFLMDPKRPQPSKRFEPKKPRARVTFESPREDLQRPREEPRDFHRNWKRRFNNGMDKRSKVDYNDMEMFQNDY